MELIKKHKNVLIAKIFYLYFALDLKISDSEWNFEISIPERFYTFENISLNLKNDVLGINIKEITVDNVRMKIVLEWDEYENNISSQSADFIQKLIYVSDENGNIYYMQEGSSKDNMVTRYFDINKNMLDLKYFLNIQTNNNVNTSEIIK